MDREFNPTIYDYHKNPDTCDLLILAAGFEDRSIAFLSNSSFNRNAFCILIKFVNDMPENTARLKDYLEIIGRSFAKDRLLEVEIKSDSPSNFSSNLENVLQNLPGIAGNIWIDISGLPSHAICTTLRLSRRQYPSREQVIIYTAALEYFPTKDEYKRLAKSQSNGVEYLPSSMALGMSSILYIESFSGHRSKDGATCLTVFAGYDAPRSSGAINEINPAKLVLLYGRPGGSDLSWRLDLSKQLHQRFETTRNAATEIISTLNPQEALNTLEKYYEYLFDDYDLTIAPVCSKMQTVAAYLFWERYNEVQLIFPLPIGYSCERRPRLVGLTYKTVIPPRSSLFK